MSNSPIIAYSYIRFSNAIQQKGDSIRRQSELADKWCAENDAILMENYRDLGVSAFRGKNAAKGALSQFLKCVESGKIKRGSYLLVESLDRVSRDEVNLAMAQFLNIINAGVVIVTLSDNKIYRDGGETQNMMMDLMYSLMIMSRANEESATKSKRLKASWQGRLKRYYEDGTPLTKHCPAWLKWDDKNSSWVVIEEKAKVVRQIHELAAQGKSISAIRTIMDRSGVPPLRKKTRGKKTKGWWASAVVYILEHPAVIGEFVPHVVEGGKRVPMEPIPDYYPSVVPAKIYAKSSKLKRNKKINTGRKSGNAFKGLAFTPEGHSMYRVSRVQFWREDKARHNALKCVPEFGHRSVCKQHAWEYSSFLKSALVVLRELEEIDYPTQEADDALEELHVRLREAETQVSNLTKAIANGYSAAIDKALREAESTAERLRNKIQSLDGANDIEVTGKVNWKDNSRLRDNLVMRVEKIVIHTVERWFTIHLKNGKVATYSEIGDDVRIETSFDHEILDSEMK